MKVEKMAAYYSIFIGIVMIGMWIMFCTSGDIPELKIKPIEFGMHLLAEIITAILLILGGAGVLTAKKWGLPIYYISMGMLLYTIIMSPGYYLQNKEYGFVFMFGALIATAVLLIVIMIRLQNNKYRNKP